MKNEYVGAHEFTSKITPELKIVSTQDKDAFKTEFADNAELRKQFKLVGTHSETFHCDEVLATTMLLYTKEFSNSVIVRSRDQEMLDKLDI